MIDPKGLSEALDGGEHLLILLHDNPDPDAIASGWLLPESEGAGDQGPRSE
jgi:nanoRNase/pAp phosphatase (c-di-AMP/oligoRNAs hydrolase)